MLFYIVKQLLFVICYILWFMGLGLIFWPLPMFLLSDKRSNAYIEFLFGLDLTKDPSAGSGLPLIWAFFSLPFGLVFLFVGFAIFCLVKKYLI